MKPTPIVLASSLLAILGATMGCTTESAASGSHGTRLALQQPADYDMVQGESERLAIAIDRTGFADAVKVRFSNLPAGVRVEEDTIPAGDSKRDFVIVAAPTAAVVEKQIVTVTAKGGTITTTTTFQLTVKPR